MLQDQEYKTAMTSHVGGEISRSIAEAQSKTEPVDLEDVRQLEIDDLLAMAGYSIDPVPTFKPHTESKKDNQPPASPMAPSPASNPASPWSPNFAQTLNCGGKEFHLVPATIDDTLEFVELFYSIFRHDLIFRAMYGTASWDLVIARTITQWREEWSVPLPARLRWFKVVDPSQNSKLIAVAKWGFPHKVEEKEDSSPPVDEDEKIEGENQEIGDVWFRGLTENRERWMDSEGMYYMNTLAVLPEYQRLGLGMRIMRSVLDSADEEERGCYVEASSKGLGLYEKCGFKEVGRLEVDCSKVVEDEDAVFVTVPMVRGARAKN